MCRFSFGTGLDALDDAGMEVPFPYRTLTFKEPLSVLHEGDAGKSPA